MVFAVVMCQDNVGFILKYRRSSDTDASDNRLYVVGHKAKQGVKVEAFMEELHQEDSNPHVTMLEHHFHLANFNQYVLTDYVPGVADGSGPKIDEKDGLLDQILREPKPAVAGDLTYGAKLIIVTEKEGPKKAPKDAAAAKPPKPASTGGPQEFVVLYKTQYAHLYITGFKVTPEITIDQVKGKIMHGRYKALEANEQAQKLKELKGAGEAGKQKHPNLAALKEHNKGNDPNHFNLKVHIKVRQENGTFTKEEVPGHTEVSKHLLTDAVVLGNITYEPTIFFFEEEMPPAGNVPEAKGGQDPKQQAEEKPVAV